MYSACLSIQYLSMIALFVEGWVVFRNWSSKPHAYLLFSIIANAVNAGRSLIRILPPLWYR